MADAGVMGAERRESPGQFGFRESPLSQAVQTAFAAPQAGPQSHGGRITSQGVVTPGTGGLAPAIPKFLEERFSKDIAQNQQQAFWNGLTEARQGVAVEEIEKQQPWYSKIFGPSFFVQGAQYYTAQEHLANWELSTMQNMEDLKKLPNEAVGPLLNKSAQEFMTGSPATNAMIQQSMIAKAGPLVDMHAKARYEYLQKQAVTAQYGAFRAQANVFETQAREYSRLSASDKGDTNMQLGLQEASRNLVGLLQMPAGQTAASSEKALQSMVLTAAQDGNFHTINLIRQTGILTTLPPEKQKLLDDQIERYEQRGLRKTAAMDFLPQLVAWSAKSTTGQISALESASEALRLNQAVTAQTGIQTPLLDMGDISGKATSSASATLRAWERNSDRLYAAGLKASTQAEKEAAEAANTTLLVTMLASGQGGVAVGLPNMPRDKVDSAFDSVLGALPPEKRADFIVANANDNYVSKPFSSKLKNLVDMAGGDTWTEGFESSYQQWKAIYDAPNGGHGAAALYYGDEHSRMQGYDQALQAGSSRDLAYKRYFGADFTWGTANLSPGERKAAQKEIDGAISNLGPSWWNLTSSDATPSDSAKRVVNSALINNFTRIRQNSPGLSAEQVVTQSLSQAKANGLNIYGQWAWQEQPGAKRLNQIAGIADLDMPPVLDEVIRKKAAEVGAPSSWLSTAIGKGTDYTIIRYPDEDGVGVMRVQLYKEDGSGYTVRVTTDDLKAERDSDAVRMRSRNATKRANSLDSTMYAPSTSSGIW